MSGCLLCGRGFHAECRSCLKGKCHKRKEEGETEDFNTYGSETENEENNESQRGSRTAKTSLRDPKSTGRKRAAKVYPLDSGADCEWRGLKNCGGGLRPITGCYDGKQFHRHHGPVKNTTRNSEGNVHRICHDCHNHWHELNDLIYDESKYNLLPHDPVPATDEELVAYKLKWISGEMGREYELASSKNKEKNRASQTVLQTPDSDEAPMGGDYLLRESVDGED